MASGRHGILLWRRSCSRSTSNWELACQFHAHRQGNDRGELFDKKLTAVEDIILGGGASIAFEGGARIGLFEVRVESCRCGLRAEYFEFGVESGP